MKKLILSVLVLGLFFAVPAKAASDWPDRPVKLLTMTGPGAQIDLLTRAGRGHS